MKDPSHLVVAKRVLKYIQGTLNYGIKYDKKVEANVIGFCDSDWAGCMDEMKSTSAYVFSLGSGAFSWCSKKQQIDAQSFTEAEPSWISYQ